jgi:hypothetical protein
MVVISSRVIPLILRDGPFILPPSGPWYGVHGARHQWHCLDTSSPKLKLTADS